MKGKMTTGAGKPSRSEPWKQTPESRPPRQSCHWRWAEGDANPTPTSVSPHSLSDLASKLLGSGGWWWQGPCVREAMSSTGSQGCFSSPPGDLSYFWERSEVTFRAEGERKGGACSLWEGGQRKPGGLIFPVPEGGFFPLVQPAWGRQICPSLTNEPHDVGVVEFLHADGFTQEILQLRPCADGNWEERGKWRRRREDSFPPPPPYYHHHLLLHQA